MHPIAARAINGEEPIADLVRDFYGPGGPLAAAGWDVRDSQREMSLRFAEQIDLAAEAADPHYEGEDDGISVGLIEAPCGVGKGAAYLIPGFLAALRAERKFGSSHASPQRHPAKLVVSTANIALQAQLIRKDIPMLGRMLEVAPRATLMKSRANYLCRERLAVEGGSMFAAQSPALAEVLAWSKKPGCDGDRESYPGEAAEIWGRVSVGSDECGRQSCPHYGDDGAPLCFWRAATMAWPSAHIIVGNHHWVALSAGIRVLAYAVDEAHELETALRGVQERRLATSTFLTAGKKGAKVIGADVEGVDRRMTEIAEALVGRAERYLDQKLDHPQETDLKYRSPVPLVPGWLPVDEQDRLAPMHRALLGFRDRVIAGALEHGCNHLIMGQVQTIAKRDEAGAKEARSAGVAANKLIELCRVFGAVALGRPHPDWPTQRSPWAIWAARERDGRDGRDQWRLSITLTPADVAPAFASMVQKNRVMVLASATLPEFASMRLTLGLGARWEGIDPAPWPEIFATDTGLMAGKFAPPRLVEADVADAPADEAMQFADDEPTSTRMATTENLAPAPAYERRLPSPYPLARMGVLVVPQGPDPKEAAWGSWAVGQVVRAVTQSRGGALILATSNAMMNRYAAALREAGRFTVIKQGEQGRSRTISAFREDVDSVLVATRSFFQGLDVQGESCRLVVIDRIPFASPEDPLEGAVGRLLVERATATSPGARGASAWALRAIPQAAMVLVQGIGRLIRSQDDRGAVVLLDGRILAHGDGWRTLWDALPPFPVSRDVGDVGRALAGAPLVGALPPPRPVRPTLNRDAIGIDF